ncbi:solute carrier family 17 (sodium-dependent inorganic phosphate cotransporter)-like isoform X1 [Nasonia vitripennis]|uniref:Sialin n=1 Tax=Nasonia vitripennis TaxID=7425 RepID=A0A7M7M235_NASVI|nr:solute carrier family 17 (sodium-dependent inorganic phosphate cotransporter)-like isoform X1 [Nasonia vitripennis]
MIRIYNSVSIRNQLLSRSHIGASTLQKFASIMEDSKISEASKETIAVDASPCGNDGKGSCMFRHKRRYLVAVLAFFGFFISYILRVNLSIAIVKMTSNRTMTDEHGELRRYGQEFDWDTKLQGLILSSFFYGYMSTQLLGGWMASRIGGKRVFGFGIAVTAFFTILTPPITRHSVYLFIAVRVIEGICEGVTYPCIHAIWANWAPPLERSKLATLAFSGSFVGTVFAMPVCGMMAERLGWPSIFYVFGALGLVWYVCWCVVVKDRPEDDPYISDFELKYIKRMLGPAEHRRISHPWKAIISSPAVWAIIAAHFSENWGFYTMLTQLPTFMNDVLNFKLEKTGFLSGLPYLVMAIVLQISGHLADYLRSRRILTTTQVRKLLNCGAFLSQTIFMICTAYILTPTGAVACITVAVGLGGFAWSGFSVNYLDIAPKQASVIMGIGNTFATLPGIISPLITGYIVQDKTSDEWRVVFLLAALVYFVGAVIYGAFASGEKQTWALENEHRDQDRELENCYDNRAMDVDGL